MYRFCLGKQIYKLFFVSYSCSSHAVAVEKWLAEDYGDKLFINISIHFATTL